MFVGDGKGLSREVREVVFVFSIVCFLEEAGFN